MVVALPLEASVAAALVALPLWLKLGERLVLWEAGVACVRNCVAGTCNSVS